MEYIVSFPGLVLTAASPQPRLPPTHWLRSALVPPARQTVKTQPVRIGVHPPSGNAICYARKGMKSKNIELEIRIEKKTIAK